MSGVAIFVLSIVASMAFSVIVLMILRRSLKYLLTKLCLEDMNGEFWFRLVSVCVILIPIAAVMFHPVSDGHASNATAVLEQLVPRIRTAILSLLAAVVSVGLVLVSFLGDKNRGA